MVAGEYYFWNGTQWKNMATQSQIQNLLERGIYVLNENDTQFFPDINTGSYYEVAFPSITAQVDKGNIITKSGNVFTVQKTGLYEVTAAVYYSPLSTDQYNRNLLNIIMQKKSTTNNTWTDIAGGRRAWGGGTLNLYQTALIPNTCVLLQQGDQLRVVIRNSITELPHGMEAQIQAFPDHPRSKYIKIQLLNN